MTPKTFVEKVFRRLVSCQVLFAHCCEEYPQEKASVEEITREELDEVQFYYNPTGSGTAKRRLKDGDRLFVIRVEGRVAAYAYVSILQTISFPHVCQSYSFSQPVAYVYDCVTARSFRGRGYYRDLLVYIERAFTTFPITISCRSHNTASARGIKRAGFSEICRLYKIDLGVVALRFRRHRALESNLRHKVLG